METQVQTIEPTFAPALRSTMEWTAEQIQLIKNTIFKGATDDELKVFIYVCKRTGLDPFARQIHAVKRSGSMTIQTGIDGYRVIAERTGQYAGQDAPVFAYDDHGHVVSATVTVYRFIQGQRVGFTATAFYSEYAQIDNGKPNFMWAKMQHGQTAKCAEALAFRKGFPNDLSGLYTNDEMQQADNDAPARLASEKQLVFISRLVKSSAVDSDLREKVLDWLNGDVHTFDDAQAWIDTLQGATQKKPAPPAPAETKESQPNTVLARVTAGEATLLNEDILNDANIMAARKDHLEDIMGEPVQDLDTATDTSMRKYLDWLSATYRSAKAGQR